MKKMLVLALVLVLVFSGAAMADEYTGIFENPFPYDEDGNGNYIGTDFFQDDQNTEEDESGDYAGYADVSDEDGMVYFNEVDRNDPGEYTNLESLLRLDGRSIHYDRNANNVLTDNERYQQKVAINLDVQAYIPCFIEMKLTGNQGTTSAISYGPNAQGSTDATDYLMVFDNEIGGYLDDDWQSLGYGSNVAINPADDVFIGACDIFAVEVQSNDAYRYAVASSSLTGVGGASGQTLNMHMRTDVGSGWISGDTVFDAGSATEEFSITKTAGTKLEALHNFKVPFSMSTVHGQYNGTVIFRAATI